MKKKIAVGLSGGVDSSLAAYLLKRKGWDVVGFTLKFHSRENPCCDLDSLDLARRLCCELDIPHYALDAEDLFRKEIINYFINSYLKGLTPNPCAYCNRVVKFGSFFRKIRSLGFNYLATGHYARLTKRGGECFIRQGKDNKKSQEYFLALLKPEVLNHLVFPLGGYTKKEVKRLAKLKKIIYKERKESQDVCFIQDKTYPEFIEANTADYYKYSGLIKHIKGKFLGRHKGIYRYTYGQRGGLGVAWKEPLYVTGIDSRRNEIIVGEREFLRKDTFSVRSLNWLCRLRKLPRTITVKVRYNSPAYPCALEIIGSCARIKTTRKIEAITPGQLAAFYHKDLLLGGGIIEKD